jgi:DNA repair exonuclease SbcCD nuclease subunit
MNKKALFLGILIVVIFTGSGFYSLTRSGSTQDSGSNPALEIWRNSLLSLTSSISLSVIDFVIDNDHFALDMYTDNLKNRIRGFDYIIIVNKNGKVLAHPDSTQILQDYNPGGLKPLGEKKSLIQEISGVYDIAYPVMLEDIRLGEIHLGIKDPWGTVKETKGGGDNLPKVLLMVAAFVGLILAIFGAIGSPGSSQATVSIPPATKERIEKLKQNNKDLETKVKDLQKKMKEVSEKGGASGEEVEVSKRLATLRNEESKLKESIDQKKSEMVKLEKEMEAKATASPPSPDLDKIKKQLSEKDKEINNLRTQIENIKAQADTQETVAKEGDVEEMKKEELELTQRIVKKRREEIILSQRVEAKRKEELALERKIEALTKKLKEMGS